MPSVGHHRVVGAAVARGRDSGNDGGRRTGIPSVDQPRGGRLAREDGSPTRRAGPVPRTRPMINREPSCGATFALVRPLYEARAAEIGPGEPGSPAPEA